jgi:hypothetical protein
MHRLETVDDKTSGFSSAYQQFLAECRVLIGAYEPWLTSASAVVR